MLSSDRFGLWWAVTLQRKDFLRAHAFENLNAVNQQNAVESRFAHCRNGVFNVLFVGRKNFNNIGSHAGGDFMAFLFPGCFNESCRRPEIAVEHLGAPVRLPDGWLHELFRSDQSSDVVLHQAGVKIFTTLSPERE